MAHNILAVDDDPHIADLIKINLERAGFVVRTATDGQEGLAEIARERPDLIILDVMMPRVSGFDVLRALKADPATRSIPVIMLTARGSQTDVADGLMAGVDVYLTKPFSPPELLSLVSRMLSPS